MLCRISLLVFAAVVLCCATTTEYLFSGRVTSNLGIPITGAAVALADGGSTTTDATGAFSIQSASGVLRRTMRSEPPQIRVTGDCIAIHGVKGRSVETLLYTASGRCLVRSRTPSSQNSTIFHSLPPSPSSGAYVLDVRIDGDRFVRKILRTGGAFMMPDRRALSTSRDGLAKAQAVRQISASQTGYQSATVSVDKDTVHGIAMTLYATGLTLPAAVTVVESTETRTFATQLSYAASKTENVNWARQSVIKSFNNVGMGYGLLVQKSYKVIHLDNGLVRVTIAPELGMRVIRVQDRSTGTPRQMFSVDDNPVNSAGFLQNMGGLKPSYPFYEHSTGLCDDDGSFSAISGYYIDRQSDGGARVVMNLHYNQYQTERDAGNAGKYGDCPLTSVITLKPGHADFGVSYVMDNPNPLRRGSTIWDDAIMPCSSSGTWEGSWIFPTRWAIDHVAMMIYDVGTNGVKDSWTSSYFGLRVKYPFVGVYYAAANASHLRISDPIAAPGVKLYDGQGFKEIWGSTNLLFELPGGLVNPFETMELSHRFYMARGLGAKVTYANEYLAIAASSGSFKMNAPADVLVDVYEYNQTTSPKLQNQRIGPATVISGTYTQGLRVVCGGNELCNVSLPLSFPDNRTVYDSIKAAVQYVRVEGTTLDSLDMDSLKARRGDYWEKVLVTSKSSELSCLAVLRGVANAKSTDNPDNLISMANTAYRVGQFGIARTLLGYVGTRRPQQSAYLEALMQLEEGNSPTFDSTVIEGAYFRALRQVKAGNTVGAVAELNSLLAQRPGAIRALLLRAYLKRDIADALHAMSLDPGSVEVWKVLADLGYPGASERLTGLLTQHQTATTAANNFWTEVTTGTWKHARRFEYDSTWFEKAAIPAFPVSLKQ